LSTRVKKLKELEDNPKYIAAYKRAAYKYWKCRIETQGDEFQKVFNTPEAYFEWWLKY
jgi:hypothetical protein